MNRPRKICLHHDRAPGDTCVLTALVRDIALTRPGEFQIGVDTAGKTLWQNNPYVTDFKRAKTPGKVEHVRIDYGQGLKDQKHESIHFLAYFHRAFEKQCHVKIPLTQPWPDLHLSEDERTRSFINGRYWLIIAGGKSDAPVKIWDQRGWARVVAMLREQGIACVQTGALHKGHWHPEVPGALNLVGMGGLRDLLRLIWHADGVIGPITFAMHASAALGKPYVCIAGGRESWCWEGYCRENSGLGGLAIASQLKVPHRYLHTTGLLDCAPFGGCWRNSVVPLSHNNRLLCHRPLLFPGQAVPECMTLISPEIVATAVYSYYYDGCLQPIPGTRLEIDVKAMHMVS